MTQFVNAYLDRFAADIAAKTRAPVAQVRSTVERMDDKTRRQTAEALGLDYVPNGTKRGRPEDPLLAELRRLYPESSRRTIARHARALRILSALGLSKEENTDLAMLYTRANGKFNVSGFERLVRLLDLAARELDDLDADLAGGEGDA